MTAVASRGNIYIEFVGKPYHRNVCEGQSKPILHYSF